MNENKISQFIKQLSKDTLCSKINWRRLIDYENMNPDSDKPMFNMLFQSEFRQINFLSSFYANTGLGAIFLLLESNESGRDGTQTTGYHMYLQNYMNQKISLLPCSGSTIYQLINSINSYLSNAESDAEAFIDDYLSKH